MTALETVLGELERVAREHGLAVQAVGPETPIEELGLDSLLRVELLVALEDRFRVVIPDDAAATVRTVGDLAALLARGGGT